MHQARRNLEFAIVAAKAEHTLREIAEAADVSHEEVRRIVNRRSGPRQVVPELAGVTIVEAWVSDEPGVVFAARLETGELLEIGQRLELGELRSAP